VPFPEGLLSGLDVALNEAEWHDAAVRTDIAEALLVFVVLALPEEGPERPHEERVLKLRLGHVGRVVASLRHGRWNDADARVEPFRLDDLGEVVRAFGAQPLYGWRFFDPPDSSWSHWQDRLSLDVRIPGGEQEHVIELFQESLDGPARHLDVRIWFNSLSGYGLGNEPKPLLEVVAAARRWWDAMFAGDERTRGHGIVAAGPWPNRPTDGNSRRDG
jgi:hypothetical protein